VEGAVLLRVETRCLFMLNHFVVKSTGSQILC